MKKSKFFMVAGASILAVAAVFATKANKRFTGDVTKAFLHASGFSNQNAYIIVPANSVLTTTSASLHPALVSLYTATSTQKVFTLRTNTGASSHVVYFK